MTVVVNYEIRSVAGRTSEVFDNKERAEQRAWERATRSGLTLRVVEVVVEHSETVIATYGKSLEQQLAEGDE
jgi:hypothetical protein